MAGTALSTIWEIAGCTACRAVVAFREEDGVLQVFDGKSPRIAESALVLDTAVVVGDVEIGGESSVWFHSVVRGDIDLIRIGRRSNIQDLSVLHVKRREGPVIIGDGVTIGHRVVLHACTVGSDVLVGIGAIVLDGAEIGSESVIAAGTLVTPGTTIPPRSFVLGSPGRVVRPVTEEEIGWIYDSANRYVHYALQYRDQQSPSPQGGIRG